MLNILEFEENAGKFWERFISKKVNSAYEESRVYFKEYSKSLKIFYHLLGGEKAKELHITDKRFVKTSRNYKEKLAALGDTFLLPWQDEKALYLPESLAYFQTKQQNEMLYFWLVAMATSIDTHKGSLLFKNFKTTEAIVQKYSGFAKFYEKALEDLIKDNPRLAFVKSLSPQNIEDGLFVSQLDTYPCPLWIYPSLSKNARYSEYEDEAISRGDKEEQIETLEMKKNAKKIDDSKETDGFVAYLPESIMSILEQVNVDRDEDDSFDKDALYNAEDLDEITLGKKKANLSSRLKIDLDLSNTSKEEYPLGMHLLDEWDYSKQEYLINYVKIKPYLITEIEALEIPPHLKKSIKRIEHELDLMELDRIKNNRLPYGDEINLDSWIEYKGHENKSGHPQKFYESFVKKTRDMSTLILADVSLSTEAGITQDMRVIDMIKDTLIVFSQALVKLQDKFAIYTFSSLKNTNVRFEIIKNFNEKHTAFTRGRIQSIKPGYYTRMGAAIREATNILKKQQTKNRLLLILSDGKPNDVDRYDGRYGIEDTKKAILEAKKLGLTPFCITIDVDSKHYLPYLFGKNGYTVIHESKKLPQILPEIYMNLTK